MVTPPLPKADRDWPALSLSAPEEFRWRFEFQVTADLRWFDGHFPDQPVLPGVAQLFWAEQLARICVPEWRALNGGLRLKNLKFSRMILPGARVHLELHARPESRQVRFALQEDQALCSSGILEAPAP